MELADKRAEMSRHYGLSGKSEEEKDFAGDVTSDENFSTFQQIPTVGDSQKYDFPTKKIPDANTKPSWILKLIEDPNRAPKSHTILPKEGHKLKLFGSKSKLTRPNSPKKQKNSYIASLERDSVFTGKSAQEYNSNALKKKINLGPWSKLGDFISVYEWSMDNATISRKNQSPYILYFWDNTPTGYEPKLQDLFIYTGTCDQRSGPVIISTCECENMRGRMAAVWTPYGRDYFIIVGNSSPSMTARIALALFFHYLQYLPEHGIIKSRNVLPFDALSDIFDEISKKLVPYTEKSRSIVEILFEAEVYDKRNYYLIDAVSSVYSLIKSKPLFDCKIFGDPILQIRSDRANSFVLRVLDAVTARVSEKVTSNNNASLSLHEFPVINFFQNSKRQCGEDYFNELVKEIINTEISYVNKQKRLMEDFYYPAMVRIELTDFINSEYASRCMPSPQPIVEIGERLLESLGLSSSMPKLESNSHHIPSLKDLCTKFINMSCRNTYFLKYNEKTDVESLRIEPTQRVGRYRVMFESIAVKMDPGHECYDLVCRTACLAKLFSERLNYEDEISCNAKANVALCVNLKLDLPVFDLRSWYVCEINVNLLSSTPGITPSNSKNGRTLLLFSTCLIILSNNIPQWKQDPKLNISPFCCSINLSEIEVLDCTDNDFIIYSDIGEFYRFRAENEQQKIEFLKLFNRQSFLSRSQSRDKVPYDAYYQEVDGHEVYYRVIGIDALKFEITYGEENRAFGLFLNSFDDDCNKNIDPEILNAYEIVSLVDFNHSDDISAVFTSDKQLVITEHNSDVNNPKIKVLNNLINVDNNKMIRYNNLKEFSDELKSVVYNYVKLSKLLSFNTDALNRDKKFSVLMLNLIKACNISERKNNKAMSILTKKSHLSRSSVFTFAINIKKRFVDIRGKIRSENSKKSVAETLNGSSANLTTSRNNPSTICLSNASQESLINNKSLRSINKNEYVTKKDSTYTNSSSTRANTQQKIQIFKSYNDIIPIVEFLINLIEKNNNLNDKGLYMMLGNKVFADSLYQTLLDVGSPKNVPLESYESLDIHSTIAIMKSLLRDFFLYNPIVASKDELTFLSESSPFSLEEKIMTLKKIFGRDKTEHDPKSRILELFLNHLHNITRNSENNDMSISNLSNVISPIIFNGLLNDYECCSLFTCFTNFILTNVSDIYGFQPKDPRVDYSFLELNQVEDFKQACQMTIVDHSSVETNNGNLLEPHDKTYPASIVSQSYCGPVDIGNDVNSSGEDITPVCGIPGYYFVQNFANGDLIEDVQKMSENGQSSDIYNPEEFQVMSLERFERAIAPTPIEDCPGEKEQLHKQNKTNAQESTDEYAHSKNLENIEEETAEENIQTVTTCGTERSTVKSTHELTIVDSPVVLGNSSNANASCLNLHHSEGNVGIDRVCLDNETSVEEDEIFHEEHTQNYSGLEIENRQIHLNIKKLHSENLEPKTEARSIETDTISNKNPTTVDKNDSDVYNLVNEHKSEYSMDKKMSASQDHFIVYTPLSDTKNDNLPTGNNANIQPISELFVNSLNYEGDLGPSSDDICKLYDDKQVRLKSADGAHNYISYEHTGMENVVCNSHENGKRDKTTRYCRIFVDIDNTSGVPGSEKNNISSEKSVSSHEKTSSHEKVFNCNVNSKFGNTSLDRTPSTIIFNTATSGSESSSRKFSNDYTDKEFTNGGELVGEECYQNDRPPSTHSDYFFEVNNNVGTESNCTREILLDFDVGNARKCVDFKFLEAASIPLLNKDFIEDRGTDIALEPTPDNSLFNVCEDNPKNFCTKSNILNNQILTTISSDCENFFSRKTNGNHLLLNNCNISQPHISGLDSASLSFADLKSDFQDNRINNCNDVMNSEPKKYFNSLGKNDGKRVIADKDFCKRGSMQIKRSFSLPYV